MKLSDDAEIWYVSGIWAWITAILVSMLSYYFLHTTYNFVLASSGALIVWVVWPYIAFSVMGK